MKSVVNKIIVACALMSCSASFAQVTELTCQKFASKRDGQWISLNCDGYKYSFKYVGSWDARNQYNQLLTKLKNKETLYIIDGRPDLDYVSPYGRCDIDKSWSLNVDDIAIQGKPSQKRTMKKIAQSFQDRYGQANTYKGLSGSFSLQPAEHIKESKGYVSYEDTTLDVLFQGMTFGIFKLTGYSKGSTHYASAKVIFNLDSVGQQMNMCNSLYACVENATDANEVQLLINKFSHLNCYSR